MSMGVCKYEYEYEYEYEYDRGESSLSPIGFQLCSSPRATCSPLCETSPSYCLCFVLKFHFISCVQCYFQKYFHSWYIEAVLMFVEVWKDEWLGFSLIGKFWFCLTGLDQFRLG